MMKKLLLMSALTLFAYACNETMAPKNDVSQVLDLIVSSINDKDLEPLNAVFSRSAKIYEQGSVDDSWEHYRDGHLGKEIEEMEDMSFAIDVDENYTSDQMALVRGKYFIRGKMHDREIDSSGLITLSMRVEQGMWKVIHLQFSRGCN